MEFIPFILLDDSPFTDKWNDRQPSTDQ